MAIRHEIGAIAYCLGELGYQDEADRLASVVQAIDGELSAEAAEDSRRSAIRPMELEW